MQAVILAGGKGTRLAERLQGRPKPLVDVLGVPLLQRQIESLKAQGVDRFLILVNHAADQIVRFLADHADFGCEVTVVDDGDPRGTAGAVIGAFNHLEEEMLIVYGDTLFDIDIAAMHSVHRGSGAKATLFFHPNDHPHDSDLAEIDEDGRVAAFHPYPHPEGAFLANQVNAAFYILDRDILEPFRHRTEMLDFGKNLFPEMLAAGVHLHAYCSFEYIKDLGTPKRLDKVERHLRDGVVERARRDRPQACVFLDRDGTINEHRGYVRSSEQLELIPGTADAIRALNDHEFRVVVVTNQPVIARGDVSEQELRVIHAKMETQLGAAGAYVDRIYHCPHHPDAGFAGERAELKIDCDCRKPKAGLLEQVDFIVDKARSWMIGDTSTDIQAARAYGVNAVLVETGERGLDGKSLVSQDFTLPDLASAVDFITTGLPELQARLAEVADAADAGDMILLGGLARSGKSNAASALAMLLRERGLTVAIVPLDRWLRSSADRGDGVLARYDLDGTAACLRDWLQGAALSGQAPFYDRKRRRSVSDGPTIDLPPDGVLIVEGVPALAMALPTDRTTHRVYVDLAEEVRSRRVIEDLCARGDTPASAQSMYLARQQDEAELIAQGRAGADFVISSAPIEGIEQ